MVPKKVCLHTIIPNALDHIWVEKDVFSVCVLLCYINKYPPEYFSGVQDLRPFFDRKRILENWNCFTNLSSKDKFRSVISTAVNIFVSIMIKGNHIMF